MWKLARTLSPVVNTAIEARDHLLAAVSARCFGIDHGLRLAPPPAQTSGSPEAAVQDTGEPQPLREPLPQLLFQLLPQNWARVGPAAKQSASETAKHINAASPEFPTAVVAPIFLGVALDCGPLL
jgi:hypothetical protein